MDVVILMNKYAMFKADNYQADELYKIIKKHFEVHDIKDDIPKNAKVLLKPNLVSDKDAFFSVTTNPNFVFAVIRCLNEIGIKDIIIADCPGGSVLLFSQMMDVYKKTGYEFLSEYAKLNVNFESSDIYTSEGFQNKKFNVINLINNVDYVISLPKLKTHNITCMTAAVKNLFGCIPGLQKPAFHAKYPNASDFSNMLVELALTVKCDFTIVDAIDIMEGNGPANGQKRHLGLTFSSKDIFTLDALIAKTVGIPSEKVKTISASEKKGLIHKDAELTGDTDFRINSPILLPGSIGAVTASGKISANIDLLRGKLNDLFFSFYPHMNDNCTLCRKCVATCPVKALSVKNDKIVLNKKVCIGCLCCDEMCPNAAVDIKRSFGKKQR